MWIKVIVKCISPKFEQLGIEPKEEDYYYNETAYRVEEIFSFSSTGDGEVTVTFYDDNIEIIKENFKDFFEKISNLNPE